MLSDAILDFIRQEYGGGKTGTQTTVGDKHNVHHTTVGRLLSGKRTVKYMRVGTFDKMFPHAHISLSGTVTGDGNTVNSHNNFLSSGPADSSSLDRVLSAFMQDADVPDAAKVKLFNLVQKEKGAKPC